MGQAIQYCSRCSIQLRDADFEKGKAFRIEDWVCCASCAPEALNSLPPDRVETLRGLLGPSGKAPAGTKPPARDLRPPAPAPRWPAPRGPAPSAGPGRPAWGGLRWVVGSLVALGIVAVLAWALAGGSSGGRQPESARPPLLRPEPVPPPAKAPAAGAADRAVEAARAYARDHPDDLEGQLRAYGDLVLLEDRGPAGAEARKALEDLRRREKEVAERIASTLDAEVAGLIAREDYGAAVSLLQSARSRMAGASWASAVARREGDLRDRIAKSFEKLRDQAKDAKAQGRRKDLEALLARSRRWGLPWVGDDLETVLASVPDPPPPPPPPPPPRSAEGKAYLARWEQAMSFASARAWAEALEVLQGPKPPAWTEPATQEEAARDLADLSALGRAYQAMLEALGVGSRTLSLRLADGRRVSGRILSIDSDRVELFEESRKPTQFVEWSDAAAVSLEPLLKEQNADPRLGAILLVLDGEASRALDLLGADAGRLSPKYWSYAEQARARAARPSPEELKARELYVAAERDFRSMSTREKAIEAYQALRQRFKDTLVVRHGAARIERRAASGKEYYFLGADLGLAGTFALTREGRAVSIAASDPAQPGHTWVECEFYALPASAYRCWVLAGGCCAETMSFRYQATGLTEQHPKTPKRVPAEPGGEGAVGVKPAVKGLRPTHPKNEPRKPVRWEWVELALPHPAPAGPKRLRILSEEQGFGVGAVLVSSVRTRAPSEAEATELARLRALDAPPDWAMDRPGAAPRVTLDDFGMGMKAWGYVGGQEFPGATGGFAQDAAGGHDGGPAGRLTADFTGGGAYVGVWNSLPGRTDRDFRELRLWIRSTGVAKIMVRMVDDLEQCHQKDFAINPTTEWQPLIIRMAEVVGGQHWGGPNDGKWHGPLRGFGVHLVRDGFAPPEVHKGELWMDGVEGVLSDDSPK